MSESVERSDPSGLMSRLERHRSWLLLGLGVLIFLPSLGLRDLWYPDEPDIAEVCQAMFQSGDWIAPRFMGEIWVDYPPMVYWLGTISSHLLGGMSEFSLRLPNALVAIALVLMTGSVAARWFGERAGLWAGVVLVTSPQFVYEAVSYRPDLPFGLFIGAGLYLYALGCGERPRWPLRVAGFACLGLAVLSKGPLGLLLPGLVLTVWHVLRREWRRLIELAPLTLVALAVALPWYVACAFAMGPDNFLNELYAQNLRRFHDGSRGHEKPFYYYVQHIWVDLAPWTLLLVLSIVSIFRSGRWRERNVQLTVLWVGIFVLFLSAAVTKRQVYLLPAYSAAALLIGDFLSRVTLSRNALSPAGQARPDPQRGLRPARFWAWLVVGIFFFLALVLAIASGALDTVLASIELQPLEVEVYRSARLPVFVLAFSFLAGAVWIVLSLRRRSLDSTILRVAGTMVVGYLMTLWWILPLFNPVRTYRPQSAWLSQRVGSAGSFGFVNRKNILWKIAAFKYYSGVDGELLTDREQIERFFDEQPESVVLIQDEMWDTVFGEDDAEWQARVIKRFVAGSQGYTVIGGS